MHAYARSGALSRPSTAGGSHKFRMRTCRCPQSIVNARIPLHESYFTPKAIKILGYEGSGKRRELEVTSVISYTMDEELTGQDKKLGAYLLSQDRVKLAYRFGSLVAGRAGPLSDVDLGVLLDASLSKPERFKLQLKLLDDLTSILGTDRIDLVIMNDAPLSLTYEIIKSNYPLLVRDRREKIDFEHGVLSRYLDRRYYETRWTAAYLRRVAEGGV